MSADAKKPNRPPPKIARTKKFNQNLDEIRNLKKHAGSNFQLGVAIGLSVLTEAVREIQEDVGWLLRQKKMKPPKIPNGYFSLADLAIELDCSTETLRLLCTRGLIDGSRFGGVWYASLASAREYYAAKKRDP